MPVKGRSRDAIELPQGGWIALLKNTLIFDFDGTLANTLPLSVRVFQQVFHAYTGREYTTEQVFELFGPTEEGIIRKVIPDQAQTQAIEDFMDAYQELHQTLVAKASEAAGRMVTALAESGKRIGVFTGKGRRALDVSRSQLPFCSYIDVWVTGDDVPTPKPNPAGIVRCLELLRAAPAEAVYIGDSESDIVAGRAAGVTTVGVRWMPLTQSKEFRTKPDFFFTDPEEFLQAALHW